MQVYLKSQNNDYCSKQNPIYTEDKSKSFASGTYSFKAYSGFFARIMSFFGLASPLFKVEGKLRAVSISSVANHVVNLSFEQSGYKYNLKKVTQFAKGHFSRLSSNTFIPGNKYGWGYFINGLSTNLY